MARAKVIREGDRYATKVVPTGGVRVRSNTRGPENPIRTIDISIPVREVESSINCGLRMEWGSADIDGDLLQIFSGAGLGSAWATISYRGKEYAIGSHDIVASFLEAIR